MDFYVNAFEIRSEDSEPEVSMREHLAWGGGAEGLDGACSMVDVAVEFIDVQRIVDVFRKERLAGCQR